MRRCQICSASWEGVGPHDLEIPHIRVLFSFMFIICHFHVMLFYETNVCFCCFDCLLFCAYILFGLLR